MADTPVLLGPDSRPVPAGLPAAVRDAAGRAGRLGASLVGGQQGFAFPYDAAAWSTPEMGEWLPSIRSADGEINQYRNRMVARQRDLARNDAWAKGAIGTVLDNTISGTYRRISKPDHRRLSLYAKGFDVVWAKEFGKALEAAWRDYSEDLGRYNDVARKHTVAQQFRLCLGHKLVDGESILLPYWLPDRVGRGRASYATAFLGLNPDRLSNPYEGPDTDVMRGGVQIEHGTGAPVGYWFRKADPNDWYNAAESMQWTYVAREDREGYQQVIHDFDADRFDQHRGVSVFAPVISRLKALARYYGVKLQAANLETIFGYFITSPFDTDLVQDALVGGENSGHLGAYQDLRSAFHEKHKLQLNNVNIPTLAPGETITSISPNQGNGEFSPFAQEMLRSVAAVLGTSETQIHKDLSRHNYSSLRGGIVEAEKSYMRRCREFDTNTADPMFACWMQEVMDNGELPLPRNAPDFREARTAYSRGRWLGVAAGWVDPVAERQGVVLGLDACLSTLEEECARQGVDYEDVIEQRRHELDLMNDAGIPPPRWMGQAFSAMETAAPPPKPSPQ